MQLTWKKNIIIIKTSSTGQSWKNKVVYKLLSQPHKHLPDATPQAPARRKTEENTIQESNHRLTTPLNPSSVPVSN